MIVAIFALGLTAAIGDLTDSAHRMHNSDVQLMKACFENGMARGRLLELEKFLAQRGARLDPKVEMMLAQPVPHGCDGESP